MRNLKKLGLIIGSLSALALALPACSDNAATSDGTGVTPAAGSGGKAGSASTGGGGAGGSGGEATGGGGTGGTATGGTATGGTATGGTATGGTGGGGTSAGGTGGGGGSGGSGGGTGGDCAGLPNGGCSAPLASDRGRIKVANFPAPDGGQDYKVLRTDINTPLRGSSAGLALGPLEPPQEDIFKPEYYERLHEAGLNTLKLAAYDGIWHGVDFSKPEEVKSYLAKFEKVINLTSSVGMYSVITYHPKFGMDPEDYMTAFWTAVAPKFGNRTNVIFELTNEPVGDIAELTDSDYQKYVRIYDLIRKHAPQTHIILFNAAIITHDHTFPKAAADKFGGMANVDWSRASMGYHLYHTDGSSSPLRVLHRAYPGMPTEQNYPKTPEFAVMLGVEDWDSHRSIPMDGDLFAVQTAEKMGAGWFHWHWQTIEKFDAHFPKLKKDAQDKGYFWPADPKTLK